MRTRLPVGTLALFLVWLAVMGVAAVLIYTQRPEHGGGVAPVMVNGISLKPFQLVDHRERPFSLMDLRDHWSFVYFGRTRCRQGCPSSLTELAYMMRDLPAGSGLEKGMQVVFATVDPSLDTPEVLARYLSFFPPDFIGVTGEPEKVRAFAAQFGIRLKRVQVGAPAQTVETDPESLFLVDPGLTVVASFQPPHDRDELTAMYTELRANSPPRP